MIEVEKCIVCGSNNKTSFITCEDHTVSHEKFNIDECSDCGFKFTSPRPEDNSLGQYYQSEEYVSHSDTTKGIVNTLYHYVRKYTLLKKLKLILRYSAPGKIIDFGCGTGAFLDICKKSNWKVYGIEPGANAREITKKKIGNNLYPDIKSFNENYPELKVEIITLWHVLEHIPDIEEFFSFVDNHLSANGTLIIAVPNCSSYDAKIFTEYWAAYDVPRHLWHFTPETITKLFGNRNFNRLNVLPMIFDSFYVSMLSNKNKHGRTRIVHSFLTGLISNLKANKDGLKFSSQIYIFKRK